MTDSDRIEVTTCSDCRCRCFTDHDYPEDWCVLIGAELDDRSELGGVDARCPLRRGPVTLVLTSDPPPTGDYDTWHKSIGSRWREKATGLVVELTGVRSFYSVPCKAAVIALTYRIPLAFGSTTVFADEFCREFEPESDVDEAIAQRCRVGSVKV